MTAAYLGIKGTRGVQQFLPNTYPIGAVNPCPSCPAGFVYQASGGDSTRQAGQIQMRRRLRSGFTASLLYTYSKSIDDDAMLGGQGHVLASSQTAAPSGGQGQNSGQGSGQGGTGTTATTSQSAATTPSHRAELAQPACRAFSFLFRSTSPAQPAGPIHQWRRPRRRNADERLARQAAKEWTVVATAVVGSGLPEHAGLLSRCPGNWHHRPHSARPYRRVHFRIQRKSAPQPRRLQRAAAGPMGNGGSEIRSPVPTSSASTARSPEPSAPADAFTSTSRCRPPTC